VSTQPVTDSREVSNDAPLEQRRAKTDPRARLSITNQPALRARKRATIVRSGGRRDITFDDLEFAIERDQDFADEMLTDKVREIEGKHVILRGFVLASSIFQQTGIKQFVLVRDNQECCFGPGAYLYHNAQVEMTPPATAEFAIRPVTVEGKFSIRPWRSGGKCYSVFHIQADSVK
jgi:hypothetical protein